VTDRLVVADEVAAAVAEGWPVVALESTIFSGFGLPEPANEECLARCLAAVRSGGAVPALTVVIDGVARVGVADDEYERVLAADEKLGARDLGPAVAAGVRAGATTVSASLHLAAAAGVDVFATGGIGGVHRDVDQTLDISHDLVALSRYPVATVTAGAKAFLDLARTVEHLETLGVPILGLGTEEFPAFWSRSSGVGGIRRVDTSQQAAAAIAAARALGYDGGVVLATPIPVAAEIPAEDLAPAIEAGLAEAERRGATAGEVTPIVLAALAEHTGGRTIPANLALAENNAAVAAELAAALAAG
jgi:pseudouridine-5'-phosphate glycosidase